MKPIGSGANVVKGVIIGFGILVVVGVIAGISSSFSNPTVNVVPLPQKTDSSVKVTTEKPQNVVQGVQSASVPKKLANLLSQAIQNYSDNTAYSFSDGSGSNVDVIGTVSDLVPAQSGVTSAFGNTVIIKDGVYSAAVHQVSEADFNALTAEERVEVQGGYMQQPANNVVQIVRVNSVKASATQ